MEGKCRKPRGDTVGQHAELQAGRQNGPSIDRAGLRAGQQNGLTAEHAEIQGGGGVDASGQIQNTKYPKP